MAHLIYGCKTPEVEMKEYPVAANQFFRHDGVNAVFLDAGYLKLALTATATLLGFAVVPKGRGAGTSDAYWKSAGTAGVDKIQVITDPRAVVLAPADDATAITDLDLACDLIAVNDGTATTVDIGTSSTDVFKIVEQGSAPKYGAGTNDVAIRINPLKYQADT